ncbi:hypothetical protein FIU94_13745 [Sulfitobacter sp. THAF37]|uniref:hypothetical protein n=1 Tax=Sulfitobacter sp. THAF37 TaxID=2587855 RepID=UPI001269445F|nr:hypothetical protein [Sulfitobacter sp. THAF37]QFT59891.1 hypothetical protein FIU94_13745 [Sulfitobacter sp. THAF37]
MKKIFALTAAVAMTVAAGASAQTTTQAAVLGNSGVEGYPTNVQGTNGQIYACTAPTTIDGVLARRCIQPSGGSLFDAGAGLGTGAAVAGAALALIVLAANDGSSGTTTTTTVD